MNPVHVAAFIEELEKIAISKFRLTLANSRSGRRPMRVDTLLKKEKAGTLYKKSKDVHKVAGIKEAVTRAVKEWRNATAGGDAAGAGQIAQGYGQLGLSPRYLKNISTGGQEGAVDLMMGRAMGPEANQSGLLAQKLYKPDSPIATNQNMSNVLAMKQQYTDAARNLSPEAKQMVPAMYGYQEKQAPGGQLRHMSQHEYVPGGSSLRRDPNALQHTTNFENTVSKPMAARGMPIADVARSYTNEAGQKAIGGNASNVMMTPQGPKMIDFLPQGRESPVKAFQQGAHDLVASASGHQESGYNTPGSMNALRQEVHRPNRSIVSPQRVLSRSGGSAEATGANTQMAIAKPVSPQHQVNTWDEADKTTKMDFSTQRAPTAAPVGSAGRTNVAVPKPTLKSEEGTAVAVPKPVLKPAAPPFKPQGNTQMMPSGGATASPTAPKPAGMNIKPPSMPNPATASASAVAKTNVKPLAQAAQTGAAKVRSTLANAGTKMMHGMV